MNKYFYEYMLGVRQGKKLGKVCKAAFEPFAGIQNIMEL